MTSARRGLLYLALLAALAIGGSYYLGARSVNALATQLHAHCKFDGDLGTVPVALNPATGKPSLLGVTIVSDDRVEWRGLHCPGVQPAADPSFIHWAKVYHLPYK